MAKVSWSLLVMHMVMLMSEVVASEALRRFAQSKYADNLAVYLDTLRGCIRKPVDFNWRHILTTNFRQG